MNSERNWSEVRREVAFGERRPLIEDVGLRASMLRNLRTRESQPRVVRFGTAVSRRQAQPVIRPGCAKTRLGLPR
jgi:hypothetical protein